MIQRVEIHVCVSTKYMYVCFVKETLTGFKWMGNIADKYVKDGHDVVFAFEEAIGYMCGCTVLDKDGISAAAVMAEFAGWLHGQGKTFRQQLEELYERLTLTATFHI